MAGSKVADPAKWTPEQKLGIETTGASLLVSAAAGSGKTAVLAERCAYLVCDAKPSCDVDQLLVVTFTEATAAEMKRRIATALGNRLEKQPHNSRLQTQLALIDRAQVSTLHGFCSRLLRQHFHVIGLDPSFKILDGDEAKLLRSEVARDLFTDRYESRVREGDSPTAGDTPAFLKLIDDYGEGNDDGLRRQVVSTHELLTSLIDPDQWMCAARAQLAEGVGRACQAPSPALSMVGEGSGTAPVLRETDLLPASSSLSNHRANEKGEDSPGIARSASDALNRSALGRELKLVINRKLAALIASCKVAVANVSRMPEFGVYVTYLRNLKAELSQWQASFGDGQFDVLANAVRGFASARLPSISNSVPGKETAKAAVDSIREQMGDKGSLAPLLRFTAEEWAAGLRSIQPTADVFLHLVSDFGTRYQAAKQRVRALDFSDLERFTLRLLTDSVDGGPSEVARVCHRQLHHVLVDEYQDINEIQDEILRRVSRECLCDVPGSPVLPNLFCVGDVKQSIYGFRLAEPARFLARDRRFRMADSPEMRVIDLQKNFRSREPLLQSINGLFYRLMTLEAADIEYDQTQELRAGAIFPAVAGDASFAGAPIELHLLSIPPRNAESLGEDAGSAEGEEFGADGGLDRTQREATFIAYRIEQLMGHRDVPAMQVFDKELAGYRPLEYRDIVILLRSTQFKSEQIADVLRQYKVPVHRSSGTGYFDSMEIRDMRAVLALLDNSLQDIPLAAFLRSPFSGLARPEDAMARIRLAYPGGDNPLPFHVAAVQYAREQKDDLAARLSELFDRLHGWRQLARQRPLADLIWTLYDQSGYLAYCSGLPNGEQRCANLLNLHERAQQFGGFARQGLYRFLTFLEALRVEADQGQPSVLGEGENVVRVMSVHKSKGLEFPVVFVADLGKRINMRSAQGPILVDRTLHLGLKVVDDVKQVRYPSLAHLLVEQRLKQQMLAEELRVLYVAMTRATEHVILLGSCDAEKAAKWDSFWGSHIGAIPSESILSASTLLDWIGPATSAMQVNQPRMFARTIHDVSEVAGWAASAHAAVKTGPPSESFAKLMPLNPAPPRHAAADAVIQRVGLRYPYESFAHLRAAISVTEWTKRGAPKRAITADPPAVPDASISQRLALPAFLGSGTLFASTSSAADIGTATHLVLQHLHFQCLRDNADLADQIERMLNQRLISNEQAEVVDRQSIEWFISTEVGQMLAAAPPADVLREIPFNYALAPEQINGLSSTDPLDQVMVRGRIDLLVRQPTGFHVIDYKTDRVWGEQLDRRCDDYTGQVRLYRDALIRFTGQPVVATHLVFLTPRVVRRV